jgi:hypothetical protein
MLNASIRTIWKAKINIQAAMQKHESVGGAQTNKSVGSAIQPDPSKQVMFRRKEVRYFKKVALKKKHVAHRGLKRRKRSGSSGDGEYEEYVESGKAESGKK